MLRIGHNLRRVATLLTFFVAGVSIAGAQDAFDKAFADSTLRVDLSFSLQDDEWVIGIDSMTVWPGWGGRRVNTSILPNPGELEFLLTDAATGDTLYRDSKYLSGGCAITMPLPRGNARLHTVHKGFHDRDIVSQHDLRLTQARRIHGPAYTLDTLNHAGTATPINMVLVPEGYSAEELPMFMEQAGSFVEALFGHEAFGRYRDRFNIFALQAPSAESGISRPSKGLTANSLLRASYDSYSLDRLITIPDSRALADVLIGVNAPYVVILANSDIYGGAGQYNDYCIGYAGGEWSNHVLVHELGHSFINLGDEYEEGGYDDAYSPDIEPDEPNITTLHDFSGKWQNLIDEGRASLIEGAGYQPKGVWRGSEKCLMRAVQDLDFCPVCEQAIGRLIELYTEER